MVMVPSLVSLCARAVVSDHSSSPRWISCLPRELYAPLLDAAVSDCRPLAVGELVQRWPERSLQLGPCQRGRPWPDRLCIQALLNGVTRGISSQSCALKILDLCGLQSPSKAQIDRGDLMGGWSLTVAVCSMVIQASAGMKERKRFSALKREKDVKRERGRWQKSDEQDPGNASTDGLGFLGTERIGSSGRLSQEELVTGVRRRMEMERKRESTLADVAGSRKESEETDPDHDVLVHVIVDLFANSRSFGRIHIALTTLGPLKLHCRYLRVEDLTMPKLRTLLGLLPRQSFLGFDIRYTSLGAAGFIELLPLLSTFPALHSLQLHYCNLDIRRDYFVEEDELRTMSLGLAQLQKLKRLSVTALHMPGQLRAFLSSLPQPLEILEISSSRLRSEDFAYLSRSHHASSLQQLDLSSNRLDNSILPSLRHLLYQASSSLQDLCLCACGLTDNGLGLLQPSLQCCRALKSLALASNLLSMAGILELVRTAVKMPSLRRLLYPMPVESSDEDLDCPLLESTITIQLNRILLDSGRSNMFLTGELDMFDEKVLD